LCLVVFIAIIFNSLRISKRCLVKADSCHVRFSIISFCLILATMFRSARLPSSPISPLVTVAVYLYSKMTSEKYSYLRHGAGSLHRRLYSSRIILVTKSIVTAAIKIHTSRPFGINLCLVVVSEAAHGDKVALHFWSGKDCRPDSEDKGRHRIVSLFHRLRPLLKKRTEKEKSYS